MKSIGWAAVLSLAIIGAVSTAARASEGEPEEKTSLDALPAAVRAAVEKATAGGAVTEIEKEEEHGRVIYDVEYLKDGKEMEIEVAEDGTVVSSDDDDSDGEDDRSDSESDDDDSDNDDDSSDSESDDDDSDGEDDSSDSKEDDGEKQEGP